MFSVDDRERVRDRVLEWASSDARVVAGAVVGSLAHGDGDRWSDLDLTFAVSGRRARRRRARRLDAPPRRRARRSSSVRPPQRSQHLPRVPASRLPSVRPLVHAARPSLRRAARSSGCSSARAVREASRSASSGARALWLRGAPRAAGPLLHRTWPLLAGRILGQRRSRLRAQPRLPPAAACRRSRAGASTTFHLTCATRSRMRSCGRWSETSCFAPSRPPSPGCCARRMSSETWSRRSRPQLRELTAGVGQLAVTKSVTQT